MQGTETGQMFADLLFNLVSLSNQCEQTDDFLHGAPLADLPLVEQIPILHRLGIKLAYQHPIFLYFFKLANFRSFNPYYAFMGWT